MEEINQSYYAVIPASVRYDKSIPAGAKLLYGEITALCNAKGFCWATNTYFAELYGVTVVTISRWISTLEKGNYIHSDFDKMANRRCVSISSNVNTPYQKCYGGINKNVNPRARDIIIENNTMNNYSLIKSNRKRGVNNTEGVEKQIENYTKDFALQDRLAAFIESRKKIKAPFTEEAFRLMLNKLDRLTTDDGEKVKIINESILGGWKGIFPLKNDFERKDKKGVTDDWQELYEEERQRKEQL